MDRFQAQEHWDRMYSTRPEQELSWFEEDPAISLELLLRPELDKHAPILDVGGGTSRLLDALLDRGFTQPAVLDISAAALEKSKRRLADRASQVRWIVADVTTWKPDRQYSAWHDRAVFHFLTREEQRRAYRAALESAVAPGGTVVIGTFALDGPEQCSGLTVQRYSPESLAAELGSGFARTAAQSFDHATPAGKVQRFQFSRFNRK
ncbi:MAG TPA: class I SAM-dependent methyltransferase [Acidobacteriaceae bacterium]|nr:class I SAM-dependent methyltransferase [Acidobacteriaceae bacterium]